MLRESQRNFGRIAVALTLFLVLAQTAVAAEDATRVRILVVIDTDSTGKEGKADRPRREKNRDNLLAALRQGLRQQSLPYSLKLLEGADATPSKVVGHYKHLNTSSSEALLFYYNGHGAMNKTKGQALTMKHGRLYRAQIREAMLSHNPRLAVILTDCCSGGVKPGDKLPAEGPTLQHHTLPKPKASGSTLRDLLFRHQGLVTISAARGGQLASGSSEKGNNFNRSLCSLLLASPQQFDQNRDGFVEWREFFPHLRNETERLSKTLKNLAPHTPQAFSLGQPFQTF
jgi:hypothetical protein